MKFSVTDGINTTYQNVKIIVKEVDNPPQIEEIKDIVIKEGEKIEFTVNATDVDGDSLKVTAKNLPEGATFNSITRKFEWIPTYEQAGEYNVIFKVTDGITEVSKEVKIVVEEVDNSPVIDEIINTTINEGNILTFTISATDQDDDILTYWAENLPVGADFGEETHKFTWKPYYTQSGQYSITFNVSDGIITTSKTIVLNVLESEEPTTTKNSMVEIKNGSFEMGNGETSKPIHTVILNYDFYIGRYETTFNEYDKFCEDTGKNKPQYSGNRNNYPVIYISWTDANEYCNWLSDKEGLPKSYDSLGNFIDEKGSITTDLAKTYGYRLPTEAEWEYAAKGNENYLYSGSDNIDDVAWYSGNSDSKTHEVGQKMPNNFGIYDMSGNVWELVSDYYGSYSSSLEINPYNIDSTSGNRIRRGGSYNFGAGDAQVTGRKSISITDYGPNLGFRIVRTKK
ncbi:hypothetical protein OSSY52_06700 [Tepiditoga spiralis]|uniref:Dystroglycan-type cadherin-like domain-containing protein n=1 Tax=Tepiditoga spiralis TaxID=2108365 RepID=A0A7G1GAK5_9BACT|nr:SUMF1/EgtB/PvdO family nonheme iron enzyme [Tepiditoga spiralis]BBE30529.1 hypothetical protein OSSY52_06700 [Tepiditoga spiralis]